MRYGLAAWGLREESLESQLRITRDLGLDLLEFSIANYAKASLKPDCLLYFELNPLYAHETEAMLKDMGFAETEIKLDMFGKQRFLKAKKI